MSSLEMVLMIICLVVLSAWAAFKLARMIDW